MPRASPRWSTRTFLTCERVTVLEAGTVEVAVSADRAVHCPVGDVTVTQRPVDGSPGLGEHPDDRVFLLGGQEFHVEAVEDKYFRMAGLGDMAAAGIAPPGSRTDILSDLDVGAGTFEKVGPAVQDDSRGAAYPGRPVDIRGGGRIVAVVREIDVADDYPDARRRRGLRRYGSCVNTPASLAALPGPPRYISGLPAATGVGCGLVIAAGNPVSLVPAVAA